MVRNVILSAILLAIASALLPAAEYQLAVIPKGNSHEFWQAVKRGAERADAELDAVSVEFRGPATENDLTQQKELFVQYLAKGVDGIAIAPVDGIALAPTVEQAGDIPVVVFDSGVDTDAYTSFVATNNYVAGRKAGEEMVRLLGGAGKIVVLRYKEGSVSTEKREKGFLDVVEQAGIEVLSADREGAGREKEESQSLLVRFGDEADGIYTPNESTTTGMMLAMREGGFYDRDIVHVGFDSTPDLVDSIQKDEIKAVVVQNPVQMGYLTVKTLHAALSGAVVEKKQDTGSALVTIGSLKDPAIRSLVGLSD